MLNINSIENHQINNFFTPYNKILSTILGVFWYIEKVERKGLK